MNEDTVLDAAERAGLDLPYSCRAGVCSTCRTKVVAGEVAMAENYALEDWELEQGYVLACPSAGEDADARTSTTTRSNHMQYEHIVFEVRDGVARLTLNRPDRLNSFNSVMHAEVRDALARLSAGSALPATPVGGAGLADAVGARPADARGARLPDARRWAGQRGRRTPWRKRDTPGARQGSCPDRRGPWILRRPGPG